MFAYKISEQRKKLKKSSIERNIANIKLKKIFKIKVEFFKITSIKII